MTVLRHIVGCCYLISIEQDIARLENELGQCVNHPVDNISTSRGSMIDQLTNTDSPDFTNVLNLYEKQELNIEHLGVW
jgi:hypothetical protein